MTEAEWMAHTSPQRMLDVVKGRVSDRKLRLFACGCCRRIWDVLTDPRSREAVETSERYADGQATAEELERQRLTAGMVWREYSRIHPDDPLRFVFMAASDTAHKSEYSAATSAAMDAAWQRTKGEGEPFHPGEHAAQSALLRDIVGNPFRPAALAPAWRTPPAVSLAQAAYTGRSFDHLSALADALQEAGCNDPAVLAHCRSPGPHVRGCWVVDLVLGRG